MAYADDTQIDRNDLEGEWLKHPGMVHHYLVQVVEATHQRAIISADIERTVAELSAESRKVLEAFLKKPPTETAIRQHYGQDAELLSLQELLRDTDRQIGLLKAARDKMSARGESLVFLTRMQLADWQSRPPLESKEERTEMRGVGLPKDPPKKGLKKLGS